MPLTFFGLLLGLGSFVAPPVAWWYFVLRRPADHGEDAVAIAGLSAFVLPLGVFVLNRLVGYPIDATGAGALALVLVASALVWPRFVGPPLARLRRWAVIQASRAFQGRIRRQ